ncbi:MAG: taurine catabolism dioxygenase TauD [Gammaproteobacteria bacterium]|nr:MAG: taurine catabolism dioxygenase TauD [Gammaproteobacteria bacterium]
MSQPANKSAVVDSPFCLSNNAAYRQWREHRLCYRNPVMNDLLLEVADPYRLTDDEKAAIAERCEKYNMVIYQLSFIDGQAGNQDKSLVHALGSQLAMENLDANLRSDEDSVSSLEVRAQSGNQYIPYTNKALSWHTDGYYNVLDKQIFAIIMHCVRPAAEGGVNSLLNPENVYIALRDENPAYIEALMHPEAMTILDNIEDGKVIRAAQTGPVFMVKPRVGSEAGRLHMRFSARKRNIIWRDTEDTAKAVDMINRLLADEENVFKVALKAGQGIICNNVLHNRSGFIDSETQKRLMYRARYYDAVG